MKFSKHHRKFICGAMLNFQHKNKITEHYEMNEYSSYKLERASDKVAWNTLVEESPQGTVFSRTDYLEIVPCKPAFWLCYKNSELQAGVLLIETDDGKSCSLNGGVIYNGIIFKQDHADQNQAQINNENFRRTSFIVSELSNIYTNIAMSLSPQFIDLRPFLWHNYRNGKPTYSINIRYTSYLPISGFAYAENLENIPMYASCNTLRRREIRKGKKTGVLTEERFDPELFIRFYKETFERQGIPISEQRLFMLHERICKIHSKGLGRMFISSTGNGIPGSAALFLVDSKRAYYLYGAGDPAMRNSQTGTAVFWDSFTALSKSGVREVDMEGVNSPQRSYFKLSFGGNIVPYYHVELKS